ncbi:DNA topoisomerase [Marinomonas flavescens]|uniref:DNA topoisomerase n=1 Tax=Marinomonas flavescens TaxID=2529379 RepID=UPI001F0AF939|nr:DNA topoisomerase [Marinomonas flavescens]
MNCAHDDISVLSSDVLDEINDPDMRALFELILHMEEAEKMGNAETIKQTLEFAFNSENGQIPLVFEVESVIQSGWWEGVLFQDNRLKPKLEPSLTKHDLDAIKRGDFEITLEGEEIALPVFRLDELIEQMELYGIARPSTIENILSTLMEDSSLIDINTNVDEVSVTQIGEIVNETIKAHLGNIGSFEWNGSLSSTLQDVETGLLSADIPILMVYEDLFGYEERTKVNGIAWTDPNTLYSQDKRPERVGGLVTKLYKSGE